MCGTQNEFAKMPVALIDVLAAHQIKEGILIALLKREKTGKGYHIKTTLEETAIASLMNQSSNYLMAEHEPKRLPNRGARTARGVSKLEPNMSPGNPAATEHRLKSLPNKRGEKCERGQQI